MADDDAAKTEDPTFKKLAKGREEGNVPMSQEIKNWLLLMGSTLALLAIVPWMMGRMARIALPFVAQPEAISADLDHLMLVLAEVMVQLGIALAPLLGLLFLLALVASLVYSPKRLLPRLSNFSPIEGLRKMFSLRALLEFAKGIVKLVVVSAVAFGLTAPLLGDIRLMPAMDLIATLTRLHDLAIALFGGAVAVLTVVAVLDLVYQRYSFLKQMRMTKQEVKDEHKQAEGDPLIKQRVRRLRIERARKRMMAAIPRADVVVTNPTHYAVALEYKMETMPAPKVVAKGVDFLAKRIREVAEEHEIPIVENPPLARALYAAVELDEEIPPEHYKPVAEVIGYVMRLKGRLPASPREGGLAAGARRP